MVERINRAAPLVLIFCMFAAIVHAFLGPIANTDTFFHLRFGREFLSGWSLWHPGSVTTFGTEDWVPTQWLPQIALAEFEDWFGLAGVAWLAGFWSLCYAAILYVACRRQAAPIAAAAVTMLAVFASSGGLSPRPQVI